MKEYVNIISGKRVGALMVGEHPRCTGKTTGQALYLIGTALVHVGESFMIIDHHDMAMRDAQAESRSIAGRFITQGRVATEGLVYRMRELIKAAGLRGIDIYVEDGCHYIKYSPLVHVDVVVKEWVDGQRKVIK